MGHFLSDLGMSRLAAYSSAVAADTWQLFHISSDTPASWLPLASLASMVADTKAMASFQWSSSICRDSLRGMCLNSCSRTDTPSIGA